MAAAINPAQELVDYEFPVIFRPLVPGALRRAYAAADAAYDKIDYMNTPSGRFHRGDLIVLAAEFEFVRLIKNGFLPFEPSWESYASPTGKHLVMRSPRAQITINQVLYPHQKPRWAEFREQYGVPNMEYLFDDWNDQRRADAERKHILLLHGHKDLRFANLSVPHPQENRLYWSTDDLLKLPHDVTEEGPAGEGPTESPDADYVDSIVKIVHDASE